MMVGCSRGEEQIPRFARNDRLGAWKSPEEFRDAQVDLSPASFHFQHYKGAVVKRVASVRESVNRFQNAIGDAIGRQVVIF
jgi:hypothetical protein